MTTIVNNPTPESKSGGSGFLIGAIVLAVFVFILLYFGIPALKNAGPIQVTTPQIVVPDKIDVTVTPAK